jgi:hypothetical protein
MQAIAQRMKEMLLSAARVGSKHGDTVHEVNVEVMMMR